MRFRSQLIAGLGLFSLSACGAAPAAGGADAGEPAPVDGGAGDAPSQVDAGDQTPTCLAGTDEDMDGLDDGAESCLASKHAPVLYMPLDKDWTMPSSAEWYLERANLRFAHDGGCADQAVLDAPLDSAELIEQERHTRNNLLLGCNDQDESVHAETGPFHPFEKFFLTAVSEESWAGVPVADAATGWPIYTHVYPNTLGGANIQYWYFFPYNDNIIGFDHEGDWEHIIVRLNASDGIDGVYYAAHGVPDFVEEAELLFFDEERTRPKVWIADGSHASYYNEDKCDSTVLTEGGAENCDNVEAYRWFAEPLALPAGAPGIAGAGLHDLGEHGHETFPWQRYCGVWGGIGQISPPPQGPSCKDDDRWLRDAADFMLSAQ